jgi:hypothetical protein
VLLLLTQRDPDEKVEAVSPPVSENDPATTTAPDHGELVSQVSAALEAIPPPTTVPPPTTAPPPPPTSAPVAPPASPRPVGACGGWEGLIASYFPAEQVAKACAVFGCETGWTFDHTIHNPSSTASGAAQFINSTWTSVTGLAPPAAAYPLETQLAAAASLWRSSGWSPWSCA